MTTTHDSAMSAEQDAADALAVIEQFYRFTPDAGPASVYLDLDKLATEQAAAARLPRAKVLAKIRKAWLNQVTHADTAIGRVSLDLNPEVPGWPQVSMHPEALQLVFGTFGLDSRHYVEGEAEAFVLTYWPDPDQAFQKVDDRTGETVTLGGSYNAAGIGDVIAVMTYQEAEDALRDLRNAVRAFTRTSPDYDPDYFRTDTVDEETGARRNADRIDTGL